MTVACTLRNLGRTLKRIRVRAYLSQDEVGSRAGSDQVTISRVETGRVPTLGLLERIARALGFDLLISFRKTQVEERSSHGTKDKRS
jgi:transcriptional regulator with XRE-family HTH domain